MRRLIPCVFARISFQVDDEKRPLLKRQPIACLVAEHDQRGQASLILNHGFAPKGNAAKDCHAAALRVSEVLSCFLLAGLVGGHADRQMYQRGQASLMSTDRPGNATKPPTLPPSYSN